VAVAADSEGLEINLTPLLDLVLQLIMFFMITVNFVRVDQFDDSITLPLSSHTAEDWVFLNLDGEGRPVGTLKNALLDTPGKLKAHLEREKESLERTAKVRGKTGEIKIVVILRADKECRFEDIFTCLYSCQRAGFKHWQLRVMTEPGR